MNQDQILEEIARALQADHGPEDARTSEEIAELTGIEIRRLRLALKQLWRTGKVETVKVRRPALGRLANVTAYRFVA